MFLIILSILAGGIGIGFLLRKRVRLQLTPLVNVLIWLLLFILGVKVGSDERIVRGLGTLGVEALIVCVVAMVGSCAAASVLWRIVRRREGGEK